MASFDSQFDGSALCLSGRAQEMPGCTPAQTISVRDNPTRLRLGANAELSTVTLTARRCARRVLPGSARGRHRQSPRSRLGKRTRPIRCRRAYVRSRAAVRLTDQRLGETAPPAPRPPPHRGLRSRRTRQSDGDEQLATPSPGSSARLAERR